MNLDLHGLGHAGRPEAAPLHSGKIAVARCALCQDRTQDVRCRHRILDREIDADSADRRHGVGSIADAEQAGPMPGLKPVDGNGEQFDVVPIAELVDPIGEPGNEACDGGAKSR